MAETKQKGKFALFLERKQIEISVQRYLIDALSYMALGLFATLITGVIFRTVGEQLGITFFTEVVAKNAIALGGPGIAVAVAFGLKAPLLVVFSSVVGGAVGSSLGGPVGAFIAAVVGAELGKMVSKETPVDIVVTPAVTILGGTISGALVGPGINQVMLQIGDVIVKATELQPVPMGVLVSSIMGVLLTLPTSSTAIGLMIGISGLASGASVVGCCSHTMGFAIQSFRENGIKGFVAQGLGSPMIQIGNIVKNPLILVPPTITSAILGPIATTVFKIESVTSAAATGTSGLVSPLGVLAKLTEMGVPTGEIYLKIAVLCFIAPCVLTFVFSEIFRKMGWIKYGDLKLDL